MSTNETTKGNVVGIVALLISLLVGAGLLMSPTPKDGKDGRDGRPVGRETSDVCDRENGVETCRVRVDVSASWDGTTGLQRTEGTTTPVRIANPGGDGNATSTIRSALCHFEEQATSTYADVFIDKTVARGGAGGFASTTLYGTSFLIDANADVDIVSSSTVAQGNKVLGPGDFWGIKVAGGTNGTLRLDGVCELITTSIY